MQLSAQERFSVCVSDRKRKREKECRKCHHFCHLSRSLNDKSSEQLLTAFQDGQKEQGNFLQSSRKFTETHPEHLAQADASQQKRHHFDTCPTVMTSHPVHTAGGNRWFVSSAIYHGCFLKHLPPRKRRCDGRWIGEHMREEWKWRRFLLKGLHDNGICLAELGYFNYFIHGYTSVRAWTSEICFLNDIWVTIINLGCLWFYAQIMISEVSVVRMSVIQGHVIRMCVSQNPLK